MKDPPMMSLEIKPLFESGWCPECKGMLLIKKLPDGRKKITCLECGKTKYKG